MNAFIHKYSQHVTGVLSGFDRLVLRGTLRMLAHAGGMMSFLWNRKVLLKDFGEYAESLTQTLKKASLEEAQRLGRPVRYLTSGQESKEDIAREIAEKDSITEGLICVLTAVEPCRSFQVRKDRAAREIHLKSWPRKGLCLYHYRMDPDFGLMHARISTWLPFGIQVCINGREWLSRRLDKAGIKYHRRDNAFTWIEDLDAAQEIMDQMVRLTWQESLDGIAAWINPAHEEMFRGFPLRYYWTVHQSEWATDVMFDSRESLEAIYPQLVRGAMTAFDCQEVLRFLGRKKPSAFQGEVQSSHRRRQEGVRVKHEVNWNSVKVYDKGSVLRVETTINKPGEFTSFHASEREPKGAKRHIKMRKSVSDMPARAEVSGRINGRYLEALSTLYTDKELRKIVEPVCEAVEYEGRRARGLRPWSQADAALLEAVNDGAWVIRGFRQRELVEKLYGSGFEDEAAGKRASGRVTRQIRLLRAHGIIRRIKGTYRYQVSRSGRRILTAILQYKALTLKQVAAEAA